MTIRTVQAEALAYAAQLDRTLAAGPDDETRAAIDDLAAMVGKGERQSFHDALSKRLDALAAGAPDQDRVWEAKQFYPHTWESHVEPQRDPAAAALFAFQFSAAVRRLQPVETPARRVAA